VNLHEIYERANTVAPFALSKEYCDRYDAYDNSGIILDCGENVTKILFSLDLSHKAAERAKSVGAQLIFTHHPAIYAPLKSIRKGGEGDALLECAQAGISVMSSHLNLDCAMGGIDECLMRGLGGKCAERAMHIVNVGAYGRLFCVEEQSFPDFVKRAKRTFHAKNVMAYDNGAPVGKVASFCGAGMDEESVAFALSQGADTFVSSDAKHHLVLAAVEAGLNVLLLTHYAAENYGFGQFARAIMEKTGVDGEFFTDARFL